MNLLLVFLLCLGVSSLSILSPPSSLFLQISPAASRTFMIRFSDESIPDPSWPLPENFSFLASCLRIRNWSTGGADAVSCNWTQRSRRKQKFDEVSLPIIKLNFRVVSFHWSWSQTPPLHWGEFHEDDVCFREHHVDWTSSYCLFISPSFALKPLSCRLTSPIPRSFQQFESFPKCCWLGDTPGLITDKEDKRWGFWHSLH